MLHATSSPSADGEPKGRLGRMLQSQGIEVHEADESGVPGWIEQWCPDVISGHHAPTWALAAARHVGVPCIETFHGPHHLFGWAGRPKRHAVRICPQYCQSVNSYGDNTSRASPTSHPTGSL